MLIWIDRLLVLFLGVSVIASQWSVAASSIGVGGCVILMIIRFIFKKDIYVDETFYWLFGLFIISQVISSLLAEDYVHSLLNISRRIPLYLIFILPLIVLDDKNKLERFLAVFFIFSGLISLIELIRFLTDYNSAVPLVVYRLEYFGYPVTNGAIKMLLVIMIVPFIFMRERFILHKSVLAVILILLLITIYLTNSRNALLGLFTGLLIYGFLSNRIFAIVLIFTTLITLIFVPYSYKQRILSIADMYHPSNKARLVMWETGVRIISDSPVFGHGDSDIQKLYRRYKTPEFHGEGSHMHSNFMQLLVNFGLFGFLSWLGLMGYIFYRQIKLLGLTKRDEFVNTITLISFCSMVAFQISGITEWNFGDAEFAVVMWFSLSLAFVAEKIYINA